MKRAGLYVRCSTDQQTVENQIRILTEVAERAGWTIVRVFEDQAISGAKGRDQRPGYDALLKAIHRREIDICAAYAVDRLGRSLSDLVAFLSDIQARGCDLYLHQQSVDTSTPSGRMLFQMLAVFSEFERELIRGRVRAGIARARAKGAVFGRPSLSPDRVARVEKALRDGLSIRAVAKMITVEEDRLESVAHV
ncbi:MAG: resolvase [Brevundimonas sp.]|uniref:recombinase family protein n=1 Tax=Brevundimonas sp. TaxID=1871086 RepID=UPI000DB03C52|nr:recombinase family protein [Brevundimonas sp.]PZU77020.1 MAG: resolvase [Brevundimonas sp.]